MNAVACVLGLVLAAGEPGTPRSLRHYAGVDAVETTQGGVGPSVATSDVGAQDRAAPTTTQDAAAGRRPPAPRPIAMDEASPPSLEGPRRTLQHVGVAAMVLGAAGYAVMVVGLGLGQAAQADLTPLRGRAEIDRRRELLARGRSANQLALGAGVSGGILLVAGIVMIAIARRRGRSSRAAVALDRR